MKGYIVTERRLSASQFAKGINYGEKKTVRVNGVDNTLEVLFTCNGAWAKFLVDGDVKVSGADSYDIFKEVTGMDFMEFDTYLEKIKYSKWDTCCKKSAQWMRGYPGEHLLICPVCNKVLDSEFCLSEII